MRAADRFHPDALRRMRDDLADVGPGAEVLWIGRVDDEGDIIEVTAAARGGPDRVPALFPHMSRGDAVIHNHPGGDLRPSSADLDVASRLGNQGIGFMIVDDGVERVNVVAAPLPRRRRIPLDPDGLAEILEPGGELSRELPGYEPREGQVAMMCRAAQSFNEGRPFFAEAGTGIGKSFAYLVPAIRWAADNDERVIISTATIALQQQLMDKDIPVVQRLLGTDVAVELVKGRGNYLCLKRLEEAGRDNDLFAGGDGLAGLRDWAESTATGSRSELPFRPAEEDWARVKCEADACPGSLCALFEKCFLMKARRRAADASILVSNHHLLFADLSIRLEGVGPDEAAVLPPYRRIVLDEAHHVEPTATDLFTRSVSLDLLNRYFYRLHRRQGRHGGGLLQRLAAARPSAAEGLLGVLPKLIDAARARAETLDAIGRDLVADAHQVRLIGEPDERERQRFLVPLESLRRGLSELSGQFLDAVAELDDDGSDPEVEALVVECRQTGAGLQDAVGVADAFLHRDEHPDQVFWLETRKRSDGQERLWCHRTPLSVAAMLRQAVWEPYGTVMGVSATLAIDGRFDHWKSRTGADRVPREAMEGLFASPFDFRQRVLLGIPMDAPGPEETEEWEGFLGRAVAESVDLSGGHALVLFTSYETLRRTLRSVRDILGDTAPVLLAQGDDDRARLLMRFRDEPSSVLFATDSFWEGVDVPGEALTLVVMTRLPFRPPTNPVSQARRDAVAAAGGNPFMELTLPEAVMRFRQGFGRLMRRSDDRGAVLVLDSRLVRKQYGGLFMNSIPATRTSVKEWTGVLRDLEDFLYPG